MACQDTSADAYAGMASGRTSALCPACPALRHPSTTGRVGRAGAHGNRSPTHPTGLGGAHGLRAQQSRSFVPRTTHSDPTVRAAPNRLLGQPSPTAPNQVWVGDITYLPKQGAAGFI
nr:hypothetical protein [Hymenobacter sp. BT188]